MPLSGFVPIPEVIPLTIEHHDANVLDGIASDFHYVMRLSTVSIKTDGESAGLFTLDITHLF
jgi:hypothetical protein